MANKMMRILSFLMVAMLAFALMGLSLSAEEFDIPVIEEVSEEELEEAIPEEEVDVEALEVTEADAAFALYDAGGNLVSYYADTVDGEGNITSLAIDQAVGAAGDGYTLKLLKNYEYDKTHYGKSGDSGLGGIKFGSKSFTVDGSDGNGGRYMITDKFNRKTYAAENNVSNGHDNVSGFSCSGNMKFTNIIINATAPNSDESHTYGFIGISGKTLTLENVELRNLYGVNGGAVWISSSGKLVANNVTITGGGSSAGAIAVYGGSANINGLVANGVKNVTIGIGTHGNATTGHIENVTITGCTTAISVGSQGKLSFGENVVVTGNTKGMAVAKGGKAIISNNLNITGNTSNVVLASDDLLEIDGTFTGSIGVSMTTGLKFGHLAEGTESFTGKIFKGTDANTSWRTFGEMLGNGTMPGTSYTLKNAIKSEYYKADDMIIPYRYYLKTGDETNGYVRTPYDKMSSAYDAITKTGTIYFLTDIVASRDFSTKHVDLSGDKVVVMDGLGHTLTIDDSYTEDYLFAFYGKMEISFENFFVNGMKKRQLGYIANNGGGGEASLYNCYIYGGYRAGTSGALSSVVSTAGNKSAINVKDTKFEACQGVNGVLYTSGVGTISVDNCDFIKCKEEAGANGGIINLSTKSSLYIDDATFTNCEGATIYAPAENQITFGPEFNANVTVAGQPVWVGMTADGGALKGTVTAYDFGYAAAPHSTFIKTATNNITVDEVTYSFKEKTDFAKDVIPDNGIVIGWPMYRRTGSEGAYDRIPYTKIKEGNLCTSGWDGNVLYLLKDVTIGEEIGVNTSSPAHHNAGGGRKSTINGNGHKISRTDGGAFTFVVYGKSYLEFENVIYDGNDTSALGYTNATGGGGTIGFKNCILVNGRGIGIVYSQETKSEASHNFSFDNTIVAGTRAVTGYYYTTINVNNTDIVNHSGTGLGVAINTPNSTSTEAAKVIINFTGKNKIDNVHSTSQSAAALYVNGGIVNVSGDLTITNCSTPSGYQGGAMYLQPESKLNLSGKINISGNKSGNTVNNIYLPSYDIVTVTGDIEEGSVIGISIAQTGKAFAKAANADIKGVEAFSIDGAIIPIYGAYYTETVGDGKLNGKTVIDTTVLGKRTEGRELDIVFHWPWLVKASDGTLKGYVSLATAAGIANNSAAVIYQQKDMGIDYRQGRDGIVENGDAAAIKEYIEKTEFPLWTASGNYNHVDMQAYMHIDGNGHTVTPMVTSGGEVFVLYGGNKHLTLDNFIYDGHGRQTFATIHSSAAKGTEVINVDNSYMSNTSGRSIFTVYKGGTVNVTASTINGLILVQGDGTLVSKANIYGETSIKTLEGLKLANATSEAYIDGTFTGELEVTGDAAQIKAGTGFESLKSVKSITKAGTSGATFAYYDAATGKFGWANIPTLNVVTDAGTYSDGTEKPGVVRFKTTFATVTDGSIASYGIYALGSNSFSGTMNEGIKGFGKITVDEAKKAPAAGKSFYADVVNIQSANYDSPIYATHFIYFKGIDNPWFNTLDAVTLNGAGQDGVVKDLGAYAA